MSNRFPASKRSLAEAQNYICPWCQLPLPDDLADTERDHIIPRSRGGPDHAWNRQLLHKACNRGPGGKGSQLTPEATALAARHNIRLHEPLPTSWPGSSVKLGSGKPNPYRIEREGGPKPHKVTVRKIYEVECHTCGGIIGAEDTWEKALEMKRDHIARARAGHEHEPAA
jgi:hypothetical protein